MTVTRRAKRVFAIGMAASVTACTTLPPPAPVLRRTLPPPPAARAAEGPQTFRPSDFAWSLGIGTNAIVGEIDYHPSSGEVWTCAGQSVGLTPETPYSAERMRIMYGSSVRAIERVGAVRARGAARPGADYSQFARSVTCDGRSAFAFRNLPDGAFFVLARIHPRGRAETDESGLVILQRVEVHGGGLRQLTLPYRPEPSR